MSEYEQFLGQKSHIGGMAGFDALWIPDWLFPFQANLTEWAIRKGRCSRRGRLVGGGE